MRTALHCVMSGAISVVGRSVLVATVVAMVSSPVVGQSPSATLTGTVVDATSSVLPAAQVVLTNVDTSVTHRAIVGSDGAFVLTALPPGRYNVRATNAGFAPTEIRDVILNVGDRTAMRLVLEVAKLREETVVIADVQRVSASPSVGTVVDRAFVENLPLNGRSLQSLLELTPGVVLAKGGSGFSVNGQRSNANYLTVDGAAANVGIASSPSGAAGQGGAGLTAGLTALGGTNGVVSLEALQEFKIETSSYAPEFGRMPGAQVSLVTRSGTNTTRGSAFDYFRHDALDATNWFTNKTGQAQTKLRQHNLGGVLGGPLWRNRTFYFGSYEGLWLQQPQIRLVNVPTLEARQAATPVLRPYLEALPKPNSEAVSRDVAVFAGAWSDRSRVDAASARIDHHSDGNVGLFGRVNYSPSYLESRASSLSSVTRTHQNNTSITAGSTWTLSRYILHDIRVNYTRNAAPYTAHLDEFGGAVPPSATIFESGRAPSNTLYSFSIPGSGSWGWGTGTNYVQRQLNVVDSIAVVTSSHEVKFGLDFRRLTPILGGNKAGLQALTIDTAQLQTGLARSYVATTAGADELSVIFDNLSLYAQDVWKPASRLTLTYGIRWELVSPPRGSNGQLPLTVENFDDPFGGNVHLAPQGTPLWKTRYDNFSPRVGASYVLSERPTRQFVVRAGFGTFYDLGYGLVSNAFANHPFRASKITSNTPFPLSSEIAAEPVVGAERPTQLHVFDRHLRLPYTYQWNTSAAYSLGGRQTLTVGYVGSRGKSLLRLNSYNIDLPEWPGTATTSINFSRNTGRSDYHALQVQYQRRMHRRLQALASYTLGRSRDTASADSVSTNVQERVPTELDYGDSDFDVRHVLTAAITYEPQAISGARIVRAITGGWGVDLMLRARSATPFNLAASVPFPPQTEAVRPNVVAGEPFWIESSNSPRGRRLNPLAFAIPPANTPGNLRRGDLRGFSARQVDLSIRREFALTSGVRLQIRGEVFNLLNTPNFGDPDIFITGVNPSGGVNFASNGEPRQTLNQSLGGLNALYQIGGPRSSQLGLRLFF